MKFRPAIQSDIPDLIKMLVDDDLGKLREDSAEIIGDHYLNAFDHIDSDPNNELVVAEKGNEVVGMLQLTFIPYLTHRGSWRCLIEGVRIARSHRGKGYGHQLFEWAISRAKERKCLIVQLTSDKQRADALRFYESLGFQATHEGFKLKLPQT